MGCEGKLGGVEVRSACCMEEGRSVRRGGGMKGGRGVACRRGRGRVGWRRDGSFGIYVGRALSM